MALKEDLTVYVSGSAVVDYVANADFTTDAIEWADFRGFTLNVWYSNLVGKCNPFPAFIYIEKNGKKLKTLSYFVDSAIYIKKCIKEIEEQDIARVNILCDSLIEN